MKFKYIFGALAVTLGLAAQAKDKFEPPPVLVACSKGTVMFKGVEEGDQYLTVCSYTSQGVQLSCDGKAEFVKIGEVLGCKNSSVHRSPEPLYLVSVNPDSRAIVFDWKAK